MRFERFEDIVGWKKSISFVLDIYKVFNTSRDFGFKDQILRASLSISNNIAEGFEKESNKDFSRFLKIAKGSCGEVRSMLYVAKKLDYIDNDQFTKLYATTIEVSKILAGLIKSIKK